MKNDSSSSIPEATGSLTPLLGFAPVRQTLIAAFVASLLSGCAAFNSFPDKVKLDIPGNTDEFRNRIYAGAGMGSTHLSPKMQGDGFSVDSSGDMGTQLRLGYDVHNLLAVEVDTSVLGNALLPSNLPGGTSAEVKYSAAAVSALIYGWSGVQMRSRREGLSAYGRLGFSSLTKSSNVSVLDDSAVVPIVGFGAEYGFSNGLGMRAEITRFDSDVTYAGIGAVFRFGISPNGIGRMIANAAEPVLSGGSTKVVKADGFKGQGTVVERYAGPDARPGNGSAPHLHYNKGAEPNAAYVGSMSERWRPAMRADDRDSDGVLDNVDSCPDTGKHITVDRYGCGLFDAVLHEVTFKSGSHWLTPRARAQLDLLAETLLAFPEARIQARAHTDSRGAADMNLSLSSRRAEVVVQYLQSRGVNELQLQAVGIGEAQPLDTNKTGKGRMRNRRVDVVTLPDQDAGQLLVASNVESTAVMTVQRTEDSNGQPAGTLVASDEWNSAPKHSKAKAKGSLVAEDPAVEPDMLAANPHKASGFGKKPSKVKLEDAMPAAKPVQNAEPASPTASLPVVKPLPQPGFAPDFPFTGVLYGVTFERGHSAVTESTKTALEPLAEALKRDPTVKIAIMAHTDNQGGIAENKALSKQRAEAVVGHLVDVGIDAGRLKAEGYGELLPLVQNVTAADRKRNRRIEVRVMSSGQ